ncbi:MAG: hypothetical protein LBK67_09120 [Coriobacteriales bacterium]|jgi:hypothetical protein|nr:hypothetical protein [Coriobacteriales bacterium]
MRIDSDRSIFKDKPTKVQIPGSNLAIMDYGVVSAKDKFMSPEGREKINKRVGLTVELSRLYRESKGITTPLHDISRPRKVDKDNFGTRYWMNLDPTFETFLDTAAFATTVDLLYNPDNAEFANGQALGDEMRDALKNLLDTSEIRSRAAIIEQRMSNDVGLGEQWLSLACGNALPPINAAIKSDRNPKLTLVDFSFDNLRHSKRLAKSLGQEVLIDAYLWRNLIDPKGFRKCR